MRDIADLVLDDEAAPPATPRSPLTTLDSPLRPWGMWSGWASLGVACAGAVAQAVSLLRPRHRPVTEPTRR